MPIRTYNERSGAEFTAEFTDESGAPALPDTVHYRVIGCNDAVLQDWTVTTASATSVNGSVTSVTASVELPGSAMTLCDRSNARELHTLLIVANKDDDREYSQEHEFYVKRIKRD